MAAYSFAVFPLLLLLLVQFPELQAQQSYVNNKQLNCQVNDTVTLGFVCNGAASCRSYLTFRSTPTYNSPITIAYLLAADASEIARVNNISDVESLLVDTLVLVPLNCSCSAAGPRYQHIASYTIKAQGATYFSISNNTYQSLTTCQAMESNNRVDLRDLIANMRLNVPLLCACPTANQTAAGYRFLLTYLIKMGDSYSYIADAFSGAGADQQGILNANKLSENDTIFFFTPILVPLTVEPTKENINAVSPPPPPPPPLPSTPSDQSGGSSRKWVFMGVGIGAAVLLLFLIFGVLVWRRSRARRHQSSPSPPSLVKKLNEESVEAQPFSWSLSSEGLKNALETLTVYKFEDLQKATGSFAEANRISGSVYRGSFKGDDAAVKVMKGDVSQEIDVLRQINHSHIIRLSGFCLHEGITYLIYEYAEKGSLSDWLHNNKMQKQDSYSSPGTGILDWKQRVQIAYDIVDALNYLHNFTNPPYIHKNLKSSNILLDGNLQAKVANFGLARSSDNDDSVPVMTRHVVGTYGYMAPEYIENGLITPKLDVFAFGVVLLELMSGREAIAAKDNEKEGELLSVCINEVLEGENVREKLEQFLDPRLGKEYPSDLAYSMAQLAKNCVAHDLNSRPTVADVFMSLSKFLSSSLDWDPSNELQYSKSFGDGRV